MRRLELGVFFAVLFAAVFGILTAINHAPGSTPLIVYSSGSVTDSISIKSLEVGEFIGLRNPSLSDAHLSGLRGGSLATKDSRTDYTQSLRIYHPPLFNGGKIFFGKNEQGATGDFLLFEDALFEYVVEFGSGLTSKVEDGELVDLEDEYITMLGSEFVITDAFVSGSSIELNLFGGFGQVRFVDDFDDDSFTDWVRVNQDSVNARVKVKGHSLGSRFVISSITYVVNADASYGDDVYVPRSQCARNHMQYPAAFLSPQFDICYGGLDSGASVTASKGVPGNLVKLNARGDDEYELIFTNLRGRTYPLPLAQIDGGLMYGNRGRDLIFVEAANSAMPNIDEGDYFVLNSKDSNTGVTNVLRYDSRSTNTVRFEDLSGGSKEASFNSATGEGVLLMGEGSYQFVVDAGTGSLAIDQNNDGSISGDEAKVVTAGGQIIDLGPGFSVSVKTLSKLFDEASGDETTSFNIVSSGGDIDVVVPSPQGSVFKLVSEGSGVKSGSTKFGIVFQWDSNDEPGDLDIFIPNAQVYGGSKGGAGASVVITTGRAKLVQSPTPIGPVCGNFNVESGESCDPPGSGCFGANAFDRGICQPDCSCRVVPRVVCGNAVLESGEQCETNSIGICSADQMCSACQCVPIPREAIPAPQVQEPIVPPVVVEPSTSFADVLRSFWSWLTGWF